MRRILDGGCRLAIATDHNPGSSVHQSIPQMMQLSMANGGITLNEALLGTTYNPSISLGLKDTVGTLQVNSNADLIMWNLDSPSQIPYYGCESRTRIYSIMKNGKLFQNPMQNLWELHNSATNSLRNLRQSNNSTSSSGATVRCFSTQTKQTYDNNDNNNSNKSTNVKSKSLPMGNIQEIQQFLTNYVKINSWGQITSLPSNIDFTKPIELDKSLPHAPKRLTRLNPDETKLAIKNALKYFDVKLHSILQPICEYELETYGHIYFFHLLPPQHIWAIPYNDIPGKTMEGKAMTHMILNNLNPDVTNILPLQLIGCVVVFVVEVVVIAFDCIAIACATVSVVPCTIPCGPIYIHEPAVI